MSNENFKQLKNNLDLFYDDLKILRLKGYFGNSSLQEGQKNLLLQRTFSHFIDLVVLNAHEKVLHGGLRITLNKKNKNKTKKNKLYGPFFYGCVSTASRLEPL